MTSTRSARPVSTWPAARRSAASQPEQAAPMSSAPALTAPSAAATTGRGVRRQFVGRHRRHEHEVDVARVDARVLQGAAAGERGVLGQRLVRERAAARLDAGALLDPVVVDADARGDLAVGDDLRRHVVAEPDDARGARRGRRDGAVAGRLAGDRGEVGGKLGATHGRARSGRGLDRAVGQDALAEPGEHLAGPDLDEAAAAGLVQGEHGLAPADRAWSARRRARRGRPRTAWSRRS